MVAHLQYLERFMKDSYFKSKFHFHAQFKSKTEFKTEFRIDFKLYFVWKLISN